MELFFACGAPALAGPLEACLSGLGRKAKSIDSTEYLLLALQRADAPVLVIFDWRLAGADAAKVVRKLRTVERRHYTYILALLQNGDAPASAVAAGADDFMVASCTPDALRARLLMAERALEVHASFAQMQEAYAFESTHDALTGVSNRRGILHALRTELARSERQQLPAAVAFGDVDHFKRINDTYGHSAGDAVLREIAARIQRGIRAYDSIGRYGGEEFLVVLPGCTRAQAAILTDRLRRAVERTPIAAGTHMVQATISFGVAGTDVNGVEREALVSASDAALYHAKNNGRNQVYPQPEAEPSQAKNHAERERQRGKKAGIAHVG